MPFGALKQFFLASFVTFEVVRKQTMPFGALKQVHDCERWLGRVTGV